MGHSRPGGRGAAGAELDVGVSGMGGCMENAVRCGRVAWHRSSRTQPRLADGASFGKRDLLARTQSLFICPLASEQISAALEFGRVGAAQRSGQDAPLPEPGSRGDP